MKRTTIALIAVVLLAGLTGCVGGESDNGTPTPESGEEDGTGVEVVPNDEVDEGVYRFVDEEAGVVCYTYRDDANDMAVGGTGGLSCVPIEQTNISEDG